MSVIMHLCSNHVALFWFCVFQIFTHHYQIIAFQFHHWYNLWPEIICPINMSHFPFSFCWSCCKLRCVIFIGITLGNLLLIVLELTETSGSFYTLMLTADNILLACLEDVKFSFFDNKFCTIFHQPLPVFSCFVFVNMSSDTVNQSSDSRCSH